MVNLESLIDNVQQKDNTKAKEVKEALAIALLSLNEQLRISTEYRNRKILKAISMLQTDKIFRKMLLPYVLNQKHFKRRYAKEIMKCYAILGNALGNIEANEKDSFFQNILHRNR